MRGREYVVKGSIYGMMEGKEARTEVSMIGISTWENFTIPRHRI